MDKQIRKCPTFLHVGGGLILLFLLILPACGTGSPLPAESPRAEVGYPAPDFRLKDLTGREVWLSAHKGDIVVLTFWATWCSACRREMPVLQNLHQRGAGEITVIAVSVGEKRDTVFTYMQKNGYSFPVLLDPDMQAGNTYKARSIPTTFIIDSAGYIRFHRRGVMPAGELERALATVKTLQ